MLHSLTFKTPTYSVYIRFISIHFISALAAGNPRLEILFLC